MAIRPVWLQFNNGVTFSSTGTTSTDLLTGHLTTLNQSERTIVSIRGSVGVFASTVASATPDSFDLQWGLTSGPSSMVAADFPDLATDGVVNPGWMYRELYTGVVTGDGTNSLQVYNSNRPFEVKAKRSLQGIGLTTLWMVVRVTSAVSAGTIRVTGQILLAQKS